MFFFPVTFLHDFVQLISAIYLRSCLILHQMRSYLQKYKLQMDPETLLSYIFQLSTALSYLESKNFVHR